MRLLGLLCIVALSFSSADDAPAPKPTSRTESLLMGVRSVGPTDPKISLDLLDARLPLKNNRFRSVSDGQGVTAYILDGGKRSQMTQIPEFPASRLPGNDIDIIDPTGQTAPCIDSAAGTNHAAAVASILGGETLGVANRVNLVFVRVADCNGGFKVGDEESMGTIVSLRDGLDWLTSAANPNFDTTTSRFKTPSVVNISAGNQAASPEFEFSHEAAIRRVIRAGAVVVVAAGNWTTFEKDNSWAFTPGRIGFTARTGPYPGDLYLDERVISVGGLMVTDPPTPPAIGPYRLWVCKPRAGAVCGAIHAGSSVSGDGVDIYALAHDVQGAWVAPQLPGSAYDFWSDPQYRRRFVISGQQLRSGTSFAAPQVAGIAAALLARDASLYADPGCTTNCQPGPLTARHTWERIAALATVTDLPVEPPPSQPGIPYPGPYVIPGALIANVGDPAAGSDFNRDGYGDVLWHNVATGATSEWWMKGAVVTPQAVDPVVDPNFKIVGVGDFQGDGRADILWRNETTGANVIWLMNGATVSASSMLPTVGVGWSVAGVGDFQGDGKADIVWRNNGTGDNSIWLMDGFAVAASAPLPSVDVNFKIVGVGDFQGDGNDDLLWRNGNTGANVLWFMSGLSVASGQVLETVPSPDWTVAGVGDFQDDGKADILWRNRVTGDNSVWLMDGAAKAASAPLPSVADINWKVARVADFDGDGMADVLWRNGVTGSNSVWLMNGLQPGTTAALPTVSDPNWQVVPQP